MDTVLFFGFSTAYVLLLIWGISLVVRRRRLITSDVVLLVIGGLVYDNAVLAIGSFIGEDPGLEAANAARYWLHALVTPLLVLAAWNMLIRAGARWAKSTWAAFAAFAVTAALIVYEIIVGAATAQLVANREYGVLSYSNENAPGGPPLMVLVIAAALLVAGAYVWKRERWPLLFLVTVVMVVGSAVPIPVPSGAITNLFELVLLVGVVATIMFQDRESRSRG
ncbi:hypothetical protein [Microbacterium paludicola]|uniref:hypothetical protein n=1 Tax=Microbacterium paludicola TaxID=300019 RepID=UPI0011A224FA|nr:hypothetical protein [Microbacterium paludicola]